MRRRAVLEGAVAGRRSAPRRPAGSRPTISKAATIGSGRLVADRARGDFEAVADRVVLVGLDRQRILVQQRFEAALRHRERVVGEIDLLVFLAPFEEREVDDPARARSGRGRRGSAPRRPRCGLRRQTCRTWPGRRRRRSRRRPSSRPSWRADRVGALLADVLGKRAGACELAVFLPPEDVAEARLAWLLRPGVHAVAEGAASRRSWPGSPRLRPSGSSAIMPAKTLKPEPREVLGHGLHLDRVAQVRLVGAVFADGRHRRECAAIPWSRGLPSANSSNIGRHHRTPSCSRRLPGRRSSFPRRAGRTRPAGGRRAGLRRGSTARSGNSGRSRPPSAAACTAAAPAAARRSVPAMNAARHQEVARAFRRRRGQDRRRELGEADFVHAAAHRRRDLRAA